MDPYAIQNTFLYQLSCDMFIQEFLYAAKSPLLYKGIALSRNPMQIAVCASLQTLANVGGYVATGPVSLVSTGPLFFSHSWLAWHRQLAPLLSGRSCKAPKHVRAMLKLARWLRTVRKPLPSLCSNNFLFFQANNHSLASLIHEGCGLQKWKAETSVVRCNGQKG